MNMTQTRLPLTRAHDLRLLTMVMNPVHVMEPYIRALMCNLPLLSTNAYTAIEQDGIWIAKLRLSSSEQINSNMMSL